MDNRPIHWMADNYCDHCHVSFWVGCSQTHGEHVHVGEYLLCWSCGHNTGIVEICQMATARHDLGLRLKQIVFQREHPAEFAEWKFGQDWRDAHSENRYRDMMKPTWDYYADCAARGIKPKTLADYGPFKRYRPLDAARERLRRSLDLQESEAWCRALVYASSLDGPDEEALRRDNIFIGTT